MKKEMAEMVGDALVYSEAISENTITITASGKDDYAASSGSWSYVLEGDYITYVPKAGDYQGGIFFLYIADAVAGYLGMDSDLVNGYITGMDLKNIQNDYYSTEKDAGGNVTKMKLYAGGAYDMKELDSFYVDEEALKLFTPLTKNNISATTHIGKVRMYLSGKKTSVDIFIGEHGGLTKLAYQSLIETVKYMKPSGSEEFIENYKELGEVSTETYQASYVTEQTELPEGLQDEKAQYKYIKVHFSTPSLSASSLSMKAGDFEFLMAEECEVKKWSSSNQSVAKVDGGQVIALKKGKATITATLTDGKKLTCKVKVKTSPKIKVGGKAYQKNRMYTIKKKSALKVTVTGKADAVDNVYKSSQKSVARVVSAKTAKTIKIKAAGQGTSKITVRINGVDFVFRVKVN